MSTKSRTNTLEYRSSLNFLLTWGLIMAVIYAIVVIIFPLTPYIYREGTMLDIEMILSEGRKSFIYVYLAGLVILFFAYWQMMRRVQIFSHEHAEDAEHLRVWILGISIVCGIILLGLYPITAIDVALYVVRAHIWAFFGGNPLTALPAKFPQDPYIAIAGEFAKEPSPYGPVWELVAQIPLRMGITDIAWGIVAMKFISLVSYAVAGWLIGWHMDESLQKKISQPLALAFFALNPLMLLEVIGNGHNDMLMLCLMILGLMLWQKNRWIEACIALTLATLVKITGLILIPLFGIALLTSAQSWSDRIKRGAALLGIFLLLSIGLYRLMGPLPDVFSGAIKAVTDRRGFSPPYALYVLVRLVWDKGLAYVLPGARDLFILYYLYILIMMSLKRITLLRAGFAVFTAQLLLGAAFRIWYPLWLIPFAVLDLNPRTFWRTFLFSITAELSILSYFILWRWWLGKIDWDMTSPWDYFTIMTLITVPWTFGIPFIPEWIRALRKKNNMSEDLVI